MNKPLGVAIQGAGWVAGEHIRAYLNNPNTEIKVINSPVRAELDQKKQEFGLTCDLWTERFDEMVARDDVDIVAICSINCFHAEQGIKAARNGKHVFIEKPIAITIDELRDLRQAIHEAGVKSMAGFVLHWNPLMQILHRLIRLGDIGDIYYIAADYMHEMFGAWKTQEKLAGNSLLMGGCHAVDIVRWLMGDEVVEVTAYAPEIKRRVDYEFPPTYMLMAKFAGGAVGRVSSCIECDMPYIFNVEALGTKGNIVNDKVYADRFKGQTDFIRIPTEIPDSADVAHHPFQGEIDHFVECIFEDRLPDIDIRDSYKPHEICFAAIQSAKEGRPVSLPLLPPLE